MTIFVKFEMPNYAITVGMEVIPQKGDTVTHGGKSFVVSKIEHMINSSTLYSTTPTWSVVVWLTPETLI